MLIGISGYFAFIYKKVGTVFKGMLNGKIAEPDFDEQAKTITSSARDNQYLYIDVYKWKNGKLIKISSKKESLFD